MGNKTFKESTEDYNAKYMVKIQSELQEAIPKLAMAFVKQRMKYYGIDKRYLPPEFRGQATVAPKEVEENVPDV